MGARLERADGVIKRAYEGPIDLTIDLGMGWGSETYSAEIGLVRSGVKDSNDFNSGSMEVDGFFSALGVTADDLRAGLYDGATAWLFIVVWSDPAAGIIKHSRWDVGEIESAAGFKAALASLIERLNVPVVGTLNVWCEHAFMGAGCGVVQSPAAWAALTLYDDDEPRDATLRDQVTHASEPDRIFELKEGGGGTSGASAPTFNATVDGETTDGTVTWLTKRARSRGATINVVTDRSEFTVTVTTDAPDDYFAKAVITSGPNAGQTRNIDSYTAATKTVVLETPLPFDATASEALTLIARCVKDIADSALGCDAYKNTENFRGAANLGGDKRQLQIAGAR